MIDHVASQRVEKSVSNDFAFSRWADTEVAVVAAQTFPVKHDRVLVLDPAEKPAMCTSLTVTCGEKLVQTNLGPTTFVPHGRVGR